MTKSELIEAVSQKLNNFTKKDMELIVNSIFESIKDALARGEKVEIRGFGSFRVKERRERNGRNPRTGEEIKIESKKIPFFRVGKELRDRLNK